MFYELKRFCGHAALGACFFFCSRSTTYYNCGDSYVAIQVTHDSVYIWWTYYKVFTSEILVMHAESVPYLFESSAYSLFSLWIATDQTIMWIFCTDRLGCSSYVFHSPFSFYLWQRESLRISASLVFYKCSSL